VGVTYGMHGRVEESLHSFVGRRKKERPLGRLRRRWEDEIGMDLREIGWGAVNPVGSG
jgi:hypothetical protein